MHPAFWLSKNRPTLRLFVVCVALLCGPILSAQITSTWNGGAGNWLPCPNTGTALWDTCAANPPAYPDGNYNAVIQGGPVTQNGGVSIVDLSLASGDSLIITPGYIGMTGTSIVNNGTITIGAGNGLFLQGDTLTLSGSGTVTMADPNARLSGEPGVSATLINQQTIQGQGNFGLGELAITNQGTINANTGLLSVQPSASPGIVNTGTMEASSGSTLDIIYGIPGPFNNTGGTIQALNGGTVMLLGGTYTGGTLKTSGTGIFTVPAGGVNPILNNLTNSGMYQIPGGAGSTIQGTVTNSGTFQVAGTLFVSGATNSTGSGSILLQGGTLHQLTGTDTLTNVTPHLIHGGGTVFELPLTNQSTIQADSTTTPLNLTGATTTNTGIVSASGGGTLQISNTVNNVGGVVEALASSTVDLIGTVSGGTLTTAGTGVIQAQNGTLDGTTSIPTNAGKMSVKNFDLFLQGTVNNTGTITLTGNSCMILDKPSTLTGTGRVMMASTTCIFGAGNAFTNQSTILGAGTIGDSNPMAITNAGTIFANSKSPLFIVPDVNGFTNTGKLQVALGSTLNINGAFNNLSGDTLTGGSYTLNGTLNLQSSIVNNAASITLTGAAAQIFNTFTSTNALSGLASNLAKSTLSVQGGQTLTTSTNFANAGTTIVGAGSAFTVGGSYTQTGGATTIDGTLTAPTGLALQKGTLVGKGTVAAAVTSHSSITAGDSATKPATLTISGSYSEQSTGTLNISVGGTAAGQFGVLAVSNGVSLGGTLSIKLINAFVPAVGDTFTILTGSAVSGKFATVKGTSINASEHFQVNYGSNDVTLTVVSGP